MAVLLTNRRQSLATDWEASPSGTRNRYCPSELEPHRLLLWVRAERRTISSGYRRTVPLEYWWPRRNLPRSGDHPVIYWPVGIAENMVDIPQGPRQVGSTEAGL